MSNLFRRLTSALMAIVMVSTLAPFQAFAAAEDGNKEGRPVLAGSAGLDPAGENGPEPQEASALGGKTAGTDGQGMADVTPPSPAQPDPDSSEASGAAEATDAAEPADAAEAADAADTADAADAAEAVDTELSGAELLEAEGDFTYEVLDGSYCSITGYAGSNSALVIPDQISSYIVQKLADGVFRNNAALTEVTLPNTLESIGSNVFRGCTGLVSADLSQTKLTALSSNMFDGCTALESIKWPQGLGSIGSYAFSGCTRLASITLPKAVTSIGDHAFYNCTALTKVNLPETLTTIYAYAFEIWPFTSIDIPDSVTSMTGRAFYNCTKLAAVGYPAGWKTVPAYNATYNYYTSPLEGCSALKAVTVDEGVTAIPEHAFRNQTAIETLTLANSVTSIGANAFNGCTGLKTVNWSENLNTIGASTFYGCSSLANTALPGKLETIETSAFQNCSGLTEITLPESLKTISNSAFENCSALKSIAVPDRVTAINSAVFKNCSGLREVKLPDTLTTIAAYAFENCQFTSIDIPDSVTSLASRAFYNCTKLAAVGYPAGWETMPAYNPSYGYYSSPFEGCGVLKEITVDNGVTVIPNYAFLAHVGLETIILSDTVTSIGNRAFDGCTNLESIWIPVSVGTLGSDLFRGCTKVTIHGVEGSAAQTYAETNKIPFSTQTLVYETSVISGKAVDENGAGISGATLSFYNSTTGKLEASNIKADETGLWRYSKGRVGNLYSISISHPQYQFTRQTVTVIAGGIDLGSVVGKKVLDAAESPAEDFTYTAINGTYCRITGYTGTDSEVVVPSELGGHTVQQIADSAFRNKQTLEKVVLPDTVESVGSRVFEGCTALAYVGLPRTLSTLGSYMFSGCTALTSITLPTVVTAINDHAFYNCTALAEVDLPETLTAIAAYAFENCPFTSIDLPDSVTSMTGRAFYNCTRLAEVGYPAGWKTVPAYNPNYGYYASPFEGCSALKAITVDEGVAAIPNNAFRNQTAIETVTLANSVTSIGANAFNGCTGLKTVNWSENLSTIGASTFYGCSGLANTALPGKLETIETSAFQNCSGLTEITLPESLKTISNSAFENCSALKSIAVPDRVTAINSAVFKNCTGLQAVNLPETLTAIAAYAFENCQFTSIDIPDSVTSMTGRAFYNCTKLAAVGYPAGWKTVPAYNPNYGYYASPFEGCSALKAVTVDVGVTAIPKHAFRYLTGLETVTLADSVTSIGVYAFDGCADLKTVNWGAGLSTIGSYAFRGCTTVSELAPPDSLKTIDSYAFSGCKGFRLLTLNDGLTTIGAHAFEGCAGLISLTFNENLQTLSAQAFAGCSNLTSARIPKTVETVDDTSFQNCPKVTIYCYSGSPAHYMAENGKHNFFLLDGHEHTYEDTIATEATCTREGSKIRTCTICGYYYTELLPELGHTYRDTVITPTCAERGYTQHICSRCGHSYRDTYVDPSGHSYGDWLIEITPTPVKEGHRYRACIYCDTRETQVMPKAELDDAYGQVTFTVVNAQSPDQPIKGAQVFTATVQDGNFSAVTDAQGKAALVLPVGKHSIAVAASGFLTRNFTLNVTAGENTSPLVGLSDKPVYEAAVTHREMTIDEIEAAGIDTSAPENQHVYKYELKLTFVPEIDWLSLTYFVDAEGFIIKGLDVNPPIWEVIGPTPPTGEASPNQKRTVIWIPPDPNPGPGDVAPRTGHFHIPAQGDEQELDIYPVSEKFYLIIRGEVRWLKEMFDVEMLVVNNSLTDTMEDVSATLTLPEEGGLSLATMVEEKGAQALRQELGTIPGGESRSVHWYVRGDSAGNYSISARLQGMLKTQGMEDTPIDDLFLCPEPLQVLAGNALHLHFEFPGVAYYGEDYPITITLTNTSNKSLYNISHKVQIIQGMEYYYSDGSSKTRIDPSDWISSGVLREFKPGDKIIMETSVNIFFKSEIMQRELEKLSGMVDSVDRFMTGFNMVETGMDIFDDMTDAVDKGSKAVDLLVSAATSQVGSGKAALVGQLQKELSELQEGYSGSECAAFDAIGKLEGTGLSDTLRSVAAAPDAWLQNSSEEEIGCLVSGLAAVNHSLRDSEKPSRSFNIFDSIRTAISSIPVCFVLRSVVMTEDPNNTTSIPWDYSITPSTAHYFGVASISKYFRALAKAAIGELYEGTVPAFYRAISGGAEVTANKAEAVRYIQAVEDEIAAFQAKDATGKVRFRVWWEHGDGSGVTPLSSQAGGFRISCDSANASTDAGGVLTFTGDATISVVPLEGTHSGVLYVESADTDGTARLSTYVLDVVPQHTCVKGPLEQILAPTAGHDGFGVCCCTVCGEVLEARTLTLADLCQAHTFGEWEQDTASTPTAGGTEKRTCAVCGAVEYRTTDPLPAGNVMISARVTGRTDTSRTAAITNLSASAITGQFVLAAYSADGRMIGVQSAQETVRSNGTIDLTATYAANETAASLKAFLLDPRTRQPLCEAVEFK